MLKFLGFQKGFRFNYRQLNASWGSIGINGTDVAHTSGKYANPGKNMDQHL